MPQSPIKQGHLQVTDNATLSQSFCHPQHGVLPNTRHYQEAWSLTKVKKATKTVVCYLAKLLSNPATPDCTVLNKFFGHTSCNSLTFTLSLLAVKLPRFLVRIPVMHNLPNSVRHLPRMITLKNIPAHIKPMRPTLN